VDLIVRDGGARRFVRAGCLAVLLAAVLGGSLAAQSLPGASASRQQPRRLPQVAPARQLSHRPFGNTLFQPRSVIRAQHLSPGAAPPARISFAQGAPRSLQPALAQVPAPPEQHAGEKPPAPQDLPAPGRLQSPPAEPRFPSPLIGLPPELRSPQPTKETQALYQKYVERTVTPENVITLVVGRTVILQLRATPKRIYLPDEEVARFDILDQAEGPGRQLALVGIEQGSTVLNIWMPDPEDPDKEQILSYLVRVLEDPEPVLRLREQLERALEALEKQIAEAFPESDVELALVGDNVVVRGQAKDVVQASEILRIVAEHAPESRLQDETRENVSVAFTQIDSDNLGNFTGAQTDAQADALRDLLLRSPQSNVINLLRIPGEQQVMLRVTVAEVNRQAARNIGLDFRINNDAGELIFGQLTGGLLATAAAGGVTTDTISSNLPAFIDNGQVALAIQALRQMNFARTLAEPNLVTMNGKTASFQAGGQFPVPVVTGFTAAGLQGVAFVPFGVQVQFRPTITDRDRIRLFLAAEVSTRDESIGSSVGGSANAGGTNVPGLTTRNIQTTVELREGQTLAVAGLIQNNFGGDSDRVPLWGDLPIIGRTGGFDRVSSGEQELVILITPELVHPLEACDTPMLPGADVFEPGDVEFYLMGRLESRRSYDNRATVRTDWQRQKRYFHCEDTFIIGRQGHSCCGPFGNQGGRR